MKLAFSEQWGPQTNEPFSDLSPKCNHYAIKKNINNYSYSNSSYNIPNSLYRCIGCYLFRKYIIRHAQIDAMSNDKVIPVYCVGLYGIGFDEMYVTESLRI